MKQAYIYIITGLLLVVLYVAPNMEYLLSDVASLKQVTVTSSQPQDTETVIGEPLPSFLESSSGVLDATNTALTGSADPTVPLSYTSVLAHNALQNDIDIYGVDISEKVREELLAEITGNTSGNAELEANISNTNKSETVTVGIRLLKTLADFCNQ